MSYRIIATFNEGTGRLVISRTRPGQADEILASEELTPDGTGRWSLLTAANRRLPELGYQLAYGWHEQPRMDGQAVVRTAPLVQLGDPTEVWD